MSQDAVSDADVTEVVSAEGTGSTEAAEDEGGAADAEDDD